MHMTKCFIKLRHKTVERLAHCTAFLPELVGDITPLALENILPVGWFVTEDSTHQWTKYFKDVEIFVFGCLMSLQNNAQPLFEVTARRVEYIPRNPMGIMASFKIKLGFRI